MNRSLMVFPALVLFLLVSCGPEENTPEDGDGIYCVRDADCPDSTWFCDKVNNECVQKSGYADIDTQGNDSYTDTGTDSDTGGYPTDNGGIYPDNDPNWPSGDDDGDGIPNGTEGTGDTDGDGTPDAQDSDSDNDGLSDADENTLGSSPKKADSDDDGLSDKYESEIGTNPTKKDTDGDGQIDTAEDAYGSDPKDPNSIIPEEVFYVILRYAWDTHELRDLDFSTYIQKADVLIFVDLSGSMAEEHANLKEGIKNVIIDGITASISDTAFGLVKFGTIEDQVYQMTQIITTDANLVRTAVDTISSCDGSHEFHTEALYQAATGEGNPNAISLPTGGAWGTSPEDHWLNIPPASCVGESYGGACFRPQALPIFIMCSDESFNMDDFSFYTTPHKHPEAIAAMNTIQAKFIGVDSGDSTNDFNIISNGTASVNASNQPFNYTINADGTGLSQQIVDAVIALTKGIKIDVTTATAAPEHSICNGMSATNFIKAITPKAADPADGVEGMDTSTFLKVKPGTTVTFEVDFHNDFCEPTSSQTQVFTAQIDVLGEGAFLDTREVLIIVPGKAIESL